MLWKACPFRGIHSMFTHFQYWPVLSCTLIYITVKFMCHGVFLSAFRALWDHLWHIHVTGGSNVFKSISDCSLSGLELAVAADGDVRRGRPRLPVFGVLTAVTGLRTAQVAWGARQHVGVMAVLLTGAVGGVLWGWEGRILLQSVGGKI